LKIPRWGTEISLALNFSHSGLIDKGIYVVDEIEYSGVLDKLMIHARSADLCEEMGKKRERSWQEPALVQL
jgi:phage protein D